MTVKFKCIEKRYTVAFFIRWFDQGTAWLVNTTKDRLIILLGKISEYIGLINSG